MQDAASTRDVAILQRPGTVSTAWPAENPMCQVVAESAEQPRPQAITIAFFENGEDVKSILKAIVLSAHLCTAALIYAQAPSFSADAIAAMKLDPQLADFLKNGADPFPCLTPSVPLAKMPI